MVYVIAWTRWFTGVVCSSKSNGPSTDPWGTGVIVYLIGPAADWSDLINRPSIGFSPVNWTCNKSLGICRCNQVGRADIFPLFLLLDGELLPAVFGFRSQLNMLCCTGNSRKCMKIFSGFTRIKLRLHVQFLHAVDVFCLSGKRLL